MRDALAAVGLLLGAVGLAWLRPLPDRIAPTSLPASSCETWMADAIPGVGPKSREQIAGEIRTGAIPDKATDWFSR